jgi:hypothetical protein
MAVTLIPSITNYIKYQSRPALTENLSFSISIHQVINLIHQESDMFDPKRQDIMWTPKAPTLYIASNIQTSNYTSSKPARCARPHNNQLIYTIEWNIGLELSK